MREFILSCKQKEFLLKIISTRLYLMNDLDFYSLKDLIDVFRVNIFY